MSIKSTSESEKHNQLTLITSQNDYRSYRPLTLDNGLSIILISDPKADKAAAAMNVAIGSGQDPENFAGLAHFLEHMLFLGTEKYPEAGEYQSFISKHGGSHNAFTSYKDTNYFFEVDNRYLEPSLDRFSQFFIAPLFTEAYVKREKNAVHSEYQSKLRDDGRKQFDVLKQALNPEHPYSRFSTGSLKTLADKSVSTRDAMLEFYQTYYSANRMSLVIQGNYALDELEGMARTMFRAVKNHNTPAFATDKPLFSENSLPLQLNIRPLKANHAIKLQFPIPAPSTYFRKKPTSYLASLIGHEGKGSLLSYLKAKGWATGLSAGSGLSTGEESLFTITINLTQLGFENSKDVVNTAFGYINLLEQDGIDEWRFNEQKTLSEQAFSFVESGSPIHAVSSIAYNMPRFPIKEVLHAPYAMETFDARLIRQYLGYLTPENLLLTRISPDMKTDKLSPWFEGKYSLSPFDAHQVTPVAAEIFRLPEPNALIADTLSLKPSLETMEKPENISTSPKATLWYKADQDFNTPKAQQYFSLQSPASTGSVKSAVLTQLLASWLNEASNEFAYPASLAGLNYTVYKHTRGITFQLGGYDDKQHMLLERLLTTLKDSEIHSETFRLVKQSLIKRWQNADKAPLYRQIMGEVSSVLMRPAWNEEQFLTAIEPLTTKDLEDFREVFLSQLHLEGMIIGNMTKAEATSSLKSVMDTLEPTLTESEIPKLQGLSLEGQKVTHTPALNHNDNAWLKYYQPTHPSDAQGYKEQARWMLLAHILQSPYYHEMRTQRQLGYIVFASYHPTLKTPGLSLLVQSPEHTPDEIRELSDAFMHHFSDSFMNISEQEFTEQKAGLLANILDSDDRLQARTQRLWREMAMDETHFERREHLADAVKTLQADDMRQLLQKISTDQTGVLTVQYQSGSQTFTDAEKLRSGLKAVSH
ncbi:insulinase family protein [Oceanospirillum sp.]|uniref:insulinase family protein n=1 Tax=Oceanospirillum sp. TaxID=2021254 RepID=UPI003A93835E